MEFGKHLGKGIWGLADKALQLLYGLVYVYLVVRALPIEEYGNWTLLQEIFLLLSGLITAFALNPLLKFGAEGQGNAAETVTIAIAMQTAFTLAAALLVYPSRFLLGDLMHSPEMARLLEYLPLMLVASFVRNLALILLQAGFRVRELFFTDAVHFLGAPFLTWVMSRMHLFNAAIDLVHINVVSLACSSFVGLLFTWRGMTLTRRVTLDAVKRMWSYGSFSLGGNVSSLVSTRADVFLLAAFTGPTQVAVYSAAKIFTKAYDMVTQVVQMFLLPAASQLSSRGERDSLKIVVEKSLLFSAVGMVPVMLGFIVLSEPLVDFFYPGKYPDAALPLSLFGLMALFVPASAIGSSVLMGIGEARQGFVIGLQTLAGSLLLYVILIPMAGLTGATVGYVLSAVMLATLSLRRMNDHVPVRTSEVLRRWGDINTFVRRSITKVLGE